MIAANGALGGRCPDAYEAQAGLAFGQEGMRLPMKGFLDELAAGNSRAWLLVVVGLSVIVSVVSLILSFGRA